MFEFVKDFDIEIYNEIINEVEFNIWNDRCISIIQSEIEKIIKKLFKESDIVITNKGEDGVIYREYNPSLSRLFDKETDFRNFLFENNILNESDIESYWIILKNRNIKDHGARTGEKLVIDDTMKESALKFLFKLCYNVYTFKFHKAPDAYWDEKYFQKLLIKPEEKTIEVEKIVEKEIKVVDDVELNKLKREHEELKQKFETIQKSTTPTATNFELINKLEIANKCLQNGDFENAKIAFNNCRTLNISCIDAYIGLIMCDYKQNDMERLAYHLDLYKEVKPLKENENYINMNNFCDKQLVEKFNKDIEDLIHYLKFEKPYNESIDAFNNGEYEKAFRYFQNIINYKDSLKKSKEILYIFEQDEKQRDKQKWYDRVIIEYQSLSKYVKEERFSAYIEERINVIKEKKKNEIETLIIDKRNISLLKVEFTASRRLIKRPLMPFIKHIIIKDGIRQIGPRAFEPFPNIETITLPNDLDEIHYMAFSNCREQLNYNTKNGYQYLGSKANPYMVLMEAKNFDINLLDENTKIIFSKSIINDNLKEITIPRNISCICEYAFTTSRTPNIEKVVVNHKMHFLGGLRQLHKLKAVILNAQIGSMPAGSFEGCIALENIILPVNIEKIDEYFFEDCISLKHINIPQKVKEIGWSAFQNCINLEEVVFNGVIQKIDFEAFRDCKNLKSINISNGLQWVAQDAFEGCPEQIKNMFTLNK